MASFTESPSGIGNDYGLHLSVSPDGLSWMPLNQNNPIMTPAAGARGLRDPFILRKQDGTFEIIATDQRGQVFSDRSQYVHVWDSPDLRTFTYRHLKLHEFATHTWAPEAFWDSSRRQYAIMYSANVNGRDAFYVNYTTDFVNVSAPQLFFDPGFNVLDGTMHLGKDMNYLYYKSFADGRLYGARSATLEPGSFDRGTYTSGLIQGGAIEAPIVNKADNSSTWYLWGDSFVPVNGEFYVWRSNDIGGDNWTPLSKKDYNQPLNSKHSSIASITATEMTQLINRWGTPAWNRIKSYNLPDSYIRHANHVGRIDPYPFDPYPDSQWRLVPGLADPNAVSFQSVNFPNQYLRSRGGPVVLAVDDNSAAFKADATFARVPGLADSGWTSFRSIVDPARYLRHVNNILRVDPIGGGVTERQDATFSIVY
ncbi:glycoside hydrolase family 43 protein [Actinoplanes sp. NEAU-A12]|uniref:Glycoside hydrolase family 43 protein n=1 Tax=Actinoplanes sandaracinus TaxID=3045177 RepID=A0ABT6X1C5_9ACTN|nr:glycoside hydrolase family 43 protein [Actinoplanes sandaracinus]MDI6105724.1 glycoside hydrolase family 43 protein [Actinoplanes sandaracinus]